MRTMFYFSYLLTAFGLSKSKQTSDIQDPTNTCTCTYIGSLVAGKRVKTFGDIDLYSTKGGMSIYGDTLAVAGWDQECYQLYKMYY